ncbi:MAG: Gfo/Idh/MocA family protein [Dermatophilaceae bacterium]
MRRLRVGVASFAHVHASGYASLLRDRTDVELVTTDPDAATAPPDELRGASLARQLGVRLLPSYEAMFAEGLDAVLVCTENSRHRELVEQAAAAGVHVLCEKPLATRLDDAEAMLRACEQANVILMVAYPVRFHPGFRAMREAVQRGDLGRVLAITGTNNGQAPLASRRWFLDAELAGGGALMDHTVHLADLLDDLLNASPQQVYAQVNRVVHAQDVSVETGGLIVMTYADGTVSTIDCSWSAPASYPSWGGLTLTVEGDRGSSRLDAFAEHVEVFDDRTGGLRWDAVGVNLDALMLDEFLTCVRSGRAAQPDGAVGYRTLQVVLAAYESASSGQPVPIGGTKGQV